MNKTPRSFGGNLRPISGSLDCFPPTTQTTKEENRKPRAADLRVAIRPRVFLPFSDEPGQDSGYSRFGARTSDESNKNGARSHRQYETILIII